MEYNEYGLLKQILEQLRIQNEILKDIKEIIIEKV